MINIAIDFSITLKMFFGVFILIIPVVTAETDKKKLDVNFNQNDYKFKFERLEVVHFNKNRVENFNAITYKYNRTSPVVNVTWIYKIEVGRNLQIVVQAYKFLSNEYRHFPLRFEADFCDVVQKNMVGLGQTQKCGNFTDCNQKKGRIYHFCKWTPHQNKFPPLVPSGKYMFELQGLHNSYDMFLLRGYGEIIYSVARP